LKATPRLVPPRNFTLDPTRYGHRVPWWARSGAMQLIGAVGAAASVVLIVLGVVLSSGQNAPAAMRVSQPPSGAQAAAKSAVAANVTAANTQSSNAVQGQPSQQNQAAVIAETATQAPLTPKVAQSSGAISPTLAPTLVLAVPTDTAYAAPPTRQAFALAATPMPTATAAISNAAAPTGPLAPRPNSAALPSSGAGGAAGAQNNGQVSPSNAPPLQADQLSSGSQATTQLDETAQTQLHDMTQVAQEPTSGAFQTTERPTDNKDQAAAGGGLKTQVTPSPGAVAGAAVNAAEAATMAATSAAFVPPATTTATATMTATVTSSPLPATAAGIAVVPTARDNGITRDYAATQASPQVPFLLIAGIALLVFSVMLFALGWLRSRLSRQDK